MRAYEVITQGSLVQHQSGLAFSDEGKTARCGLPEEEMRGARGGAPAAEPANVQVEAR